MEATKIFISLPFRTDGSEGEHPGCLKSFDSRHINRFITALKKELRTVSEESDDLLVKEIEIGNGSASHLTAEDLTDLIRVIQQSFHIDLKRTIRITMTPSGFDFYKLSAVRQMKNATISFELPDLTDAGLYAAGYHCTGKQAIGALDTCFQNAFHDFAVFLTAKDMETVKAEEILKRILAAHPNEVELRPDAEQRFVRAMERVLAEENWVQSERHWYRDRVPTPVRCTVQIGCGPNAVSVFDHIPVRSTADFDFYCEHSDDYEALVRHAEEE